jgi:hypothetical protein
MSLKNYTGMVQDTLPPITQLLNDTLPLNFSEIVSFNFTNISLEVIQKLEEWLIITVESSQGSTDVILSTFELVSLRAECQEKCLLLLATDSQTSWFSSFLRNVSDFSIPTVSSKEMIAWLESLNLTGHFESLVGLKDAVPDIGTLRPNVSTADLLYAASTITNLIVDSGGIASSIAAEGVLTIKEVLSTPLCVVGDVVVPQKVYERFGGCDMLQFLIAFKPLMIDGLRELLRDVRNLTAEATR